MGKRAVTPPSQGWPGVGRGQSAKQTAATQFPSLFHAIERWGRMASAATPATRGWPPSGIYCNSKHIPYESLLFFINQECINKISNILVFVE